MSARSRPKIGILKTGSPPADIGARVPTYPAMVRTALGPNYSYREFDVQKGELPEQASDLDGYVLTGSASSVYENRRWITRLRDWLQRAAPGTPIVGICFGHQIMAEAYGGIVKRADRGWIGGLQKYRVVSKEKWMGGGAEIVLPAAHQDQVVIVPPQAKILATGDCCTVAALSYADRRAISFQAHPEFSLRYAELLIARFERTGGIDHAAGDAARASMRLRSDATRVVAWIRRFLQAE